MNNLVNPSQAASLYAKNSGVTTIPGQGQPTQIGTPSLDEQGNSFSDLLKVSARNTIDSLRAGEQASAKAVAGEADLPEVVQAITAAEVTLQTVVAIRDRMVSAYQEIMRMPV